MTCCCGNTANANGRATRPVPSINPRLIGSTSRGLCCNHLPFCSVKSASGGIVITGSELITRLAAVSVTALAAATLLRPSGSASMLSLWTSASVPTGEARNTSIPDRSSPPRISRTFRKPAEATAAKGVSRPKAVLVAGEKRRRVGMSLFSPRAVPHETVTAARYDTLSWRVEMDELVALAMLIPALTD